MTFSDCQGLFLLNLVRIEWVMMTKDTIRIGKAPAAMRSSENIRMLTKEATRVPSMIWDMI